MPEKTTRTSILELTSSEAREVLLRPANYCSLDFPSYIQFGSLIESVHEVLNGKEIDLLGKKEQKPCDRDNVNYSILNNKDGKYAWRPIQLIHPALYVSLVHKITENDNWKLVLDQFQKHSGNDNIHCLSLPIVSPSGKKGKRNTAEQVSKWWEDVEQRSIELSLEYEYLIETDITDCYGSIYTHSIAWALHTKEVAKKNRKENLIGNVIDRHIQGMRNGQTNGIPQGSMLMDLIAEMVLGLADSNLSAKIENENIHEYRILRYRDDYRIFVNNPQDGERILKFLTEVTVDLGLKLNSAKTKSSNDAIRASIKADKLAWMGRKHVERTLQKRLLIIHDHAVHFPNSGSICTALTKFDERILKLKKLTLSDQPMPLIAIVTDIAYRNPRTYPVCAAILSKLMEFMGHNERIDISEKIKKKFEKIPNTGHMQIWMQRITLNIDRNMSYQEPICKLVTRETVPLWNNDWIGLSNLKEALDTAQVVDQTEVETLPPVIPAEEVALFTSEYYK